MTIRQRTFYNEFDPAIAQWIENLVGAGKLSEGRVDRRDIRELTADDCEPTSHFFAGIGGWALALKWLGLDWLECWTGSCPCQPFSVAGAKKGFDDERHLWPAWRKLISIARPPIVFGEQVAGEPGGAWFSGVRADLEEDGYWVAAADLCAASVGAHQRRQRLFFGAVRVADSDKFDSQRWGQQVAGAKAQIGTGEWKQRLRLEPQSGMSAGRMADTQGQGRLFGGMSAGPSECEIKAGGEGVPGWGYDVVACRDQRRRPIESGTWPLAYGIPKRVELIRGYGNAVVPQLTAVFIASFLEAL